MILEPGLLHPDIQGIPAVAKDLCEDEAQVHACPVPGKVSAGPLLLSSKAAALATGRGYPLGRHDQAAW